MHDVLIVVLTISRKTGVDQVPQARESMTKSLPTTEYYEAVTKTLGFQIDRVQYRVHQIFYTLYLDHGWEWARVMYHSKMAAISKRIEGKYLDGFERRAGDLQYLLWLLRK